MAGGRGERLKLKKEKPLIEISKKPLICHCVEPLKKSKIISDIFVATTENTPQTEIFAKSLGVSVIRTSGKGFVDDIQEAVKKTKIQKYKNIFIVCADTFGITEKLILKLADEFIKLKVKNLCVVKNVSGRLKPVGLNVMNRKEVLSSKIKKKGINSGYKYISNENIVNVNTLKDLRLVERKNKS